ncbi:DUF4352 domain-containing protein [Gottfriedia acidiceleris]|uniref:DUF4352 domain-containing protein n=1 Tax=Gottfriedia acidiceleris TaxID=371036 RepID=UPI0033925A29
MKKYLKAVGISVLAMGVLTACSDTSDVKTGGSNNVTKTEDSKKQEKKNDGSKKFNAAAKQEVLGMAINLADVKITEKEIQVGMNLHNTSGDKLSFYPDQGTLVVGDMQLSANMFMGSGEVSGDINDGVKMDGVIVFTAPEGKKLDVKAIKELTFNFGDVTTSDFMTTKPVTFKVPVK